MSRLFSWMHQTLAKECFRRMFLWLESTCVRLDHFDVIVLVYLDYFWESQRAVSYTMILFRVLCSDTSQDLDSNDLPWPNSTPVALLSCKATFLPPRPSSPAWSIMVSVRHDFPCMLKVQAVLMQEHSMLGLYTERSRVVEQFENPMCFNAKPHVCCEMMKLMCRWCWIMITCSINSCC